jgi:hypothetical protein
MCETAEPDSMNCRRQRQKVAGRKRDHQYSATGYTQELAHIIGRLLILTNQSHAIRIAKDLLATFSSAVAIGPVSTL